MKDLGHEMRGKRTWVIGIGDLEDSLREVVGPLWSKDGARTGRIRCIIVYKLRDDAAVDTGQQYSYG